MYLLVVTSFFPNSVSPHRTVFVKNLVQAMKSLCMLRVVAPVPYAPAIRRMPRWYAQSRIGRMEHVDGIEVSHPRYLVVPKLELLSGLSYFLGVAKLIWRSWRDRGPHLIHAHCAYPDGVGVALAARLLRMPYAITVHGSDLNVYAARRTLRPQIRWALRGADGVIAVSRDLKAQVLRLTGRPADSVECIPCAGYDPSMFFPRSRADCRAALGLPVERRIVVFVGNLVPVKGVEFLVEAWSKLRRREWVNRGDQLIIIGEGICRPGLERQAREAGTGASVRFLGAIAQSDVSLWVAAANLLCLPSRSEGMPNVVVEALASGVPVVATRVGGVPELVADGMNGLLVPPASPDALADALAAAMSRDWDEDEICRSVAPLTWQALGARNIALLGSLALAARPSSAT